MPEKKTRERAKRDLRKGKSPSTAAGEFVHEEIEHVREGKHGVRNAKQAIAIGLSKARREGIPIADKSGRKKTAKKPSTRSQNRPSSKRSKAGVKRLKKESKRGATHLSLVRQGKEAARKRPAKARKKAARKAVATKRREGLIRKKAA